MYPHPTEKQQISYFYSLLKVNALQASYNIEDTKKPRRNPGGVSTSLWRFSIFSQGTLCMERPPFWPNRTEFHEILDALQKSAREAFGPEAEKFKDTAIYAKMPNHVKKILNRAY